MIDEKELYDVIIVGGGPAGLTAAIYLARACYRVLVIEKNDFGGQITITSEVVNYPGVFRQSGKELTETMRKQAEGFGAEFLLAEVKELEPAGDIKEVHTDRGDYVCFGLLLATGAHPRMIGFEGEAAYKGHGVAYCATCDGEFFSGKEIFVAGGGFAAAEEGVFLTKYAKHVTILVREDDFTCSKTVADKARAHEKITVLPNTEIVKAEGDSLLRRLIYKNNKTGEIVTYQAEQGDTFGIFVFAGYEPETTLLKGKAKLDAQGYVITDCATGQTSIEGIYAAGDVCIKKLRQVVTAVGDGAVTATELERYAAMMQKKTGKKPSRPKTLLTNETQETNLKIKSRLDSNGVHIQENPFLEDTAAAGKGRIFTSDMRAQLDTVFSKMEQPLLLKLYLDDRPESQTLEAYMNELTERTDKLHAERAKDSGIPIAERPCVMICRVDGSPTGLAFHGVPGGHEFTAFVLGLYNAAGPGQTIDAQTKKRIETINDRLDMKLLVSLSCTMCPDLVAAAQKIASLNEYVTAEVYDIALFPAERERYQVMSVPCLIVNDEHVTFGRKNPEQLLDYLQTLQEQKH